MTGFSKMLTASKSLVKPVGSVLLGRTSSLSLKPVTNQMMTQFVRESHGRTMFIRPGKFYTKKYFDIIVSTVSHKQSAQAYSIQ